MRKKFLLTSLFLLVWTFCFSEGASNWPMFQLNLARNPSLLGRKPPPTPPLYLQWKYHTDNQIISSPAVVNGTVYFASWDEHIYAIDLKTGELKWKKWIGEEEGIIWEISASPVISEGILYIANYDSILYAIDINTQQIKWKYEKGKSRFITTPCIKGDVLYVGNRSRFFWALDKRTGQLLWEVRIDKIFSSPAIAGEYIFFGTRSGQVYALKLKNGEIIWEYKTGDVIISSPAVDLEQKCLYIGSSDHKMYCLEIESGECRWQYKTGAEILSTPTFDEKAVYFGSEDTYFYSLDKKTGQLRWRYKTEGGIFSSPCFTPSVIYFGSYDKNIYALLKEDGKLLWQFQTKGPILSSPVWVENQLLVGSGDGFLYAFGPERKENIPGEIFRWQVPLKPRKHPFLFLDENDFQKIKEKIEKYSWAKELFLQQKKLADQFLEKIEKITEENFTQIISPQEEKYGRETSRLALLYQLTGEEKYQKAVKKILLNYARVYPSLPFYFSYSKEIKKYIALLWPQTSKITGQTLHEANWLVEIIWAYDLIYQKLTERERKEIEGLLLSSLNTIKKNCGGIGNHQAWHNVAIGAVGLTLHDGTLVHQAVYGKYGLVNQLEKSLSPDGLWFEGSWGYHFYALEALNKLAFMMKKGGINLYKKRLELKKMFDLPLLFQLSDEALPNFNDCWEVKLAPKFYEHAYLNYQDARYLPILNREKKCLVSLYFGQEKKSGPSEEIQLKSQDFLHTGYSILRCGDNSVAVDYAPHGDNHGHRDKLSFILRKGKLKLGIDPGCISYKDSLNDQWYQQTISHNTVVVDERSQAETMGEWVSSFYSPQFSGVITQCQTAYPGVFHRRFLGLTQEYLVVIDHLRSEEEHLYDWSYHNAGQFFTSLPLKEISKLGTTDGYQHLQEIKRGKMREDSQIWWEVEKIRVKLKAIGEEGTEIITAIGLGNVKGKKDKVPLVIIRKKGKEVLFVVFLDIYQEQENIEEVKKILDEQGILGFEVKLTNQKTDLLYVSLGKEEEIKVQGIKGRIGWKRW